MTPLATLIGELDQTEPAGPFLLRYRFRTPRHGAGAGARGVHSKDFIMVYANALKRLLDRFLQPPHSRPFPWPKVDVYVVDVPDTLERAPFMAATKDGTPYVVLPCRIPEPDATAERLFAEACAYHEGSHVLCQALRPYAHLESTAWRWFNEATAVWSELLLSPGNPFTFACFVPWCDHPECSLGQEPYWYGAGLFAHYLETHHERLSRPGFVSRVWTEGAGDGTPIDAILRLSGNPGAFHEYAMESYFTRVGEQPTVFAAALDRFGPRALSVSSPVGAGQSIPIAGSVAGLATRFYRLYPDADVQTLELLASALPAGVRAGLATSSADLTRLDSGPAAGALQVTLAPPAPDHVVLVVSNDSTGTTAPAPFSCSVTAR